MKAPDCPKRPLLRYHGGKFRMADFLLELFPPHRVYCEPFGGGASILLQKVRSPAEIYNDIDGEIVNVFLQMRDQGPELIRRIALTPFAREEFEQSREPIFGDPMEQARRTIARSFMSYGTTLTRMNVTDGQIQRTGFRRVRRDSTTTARDWNGLPEAFADIVDRLQGVVIENMDGCKVMLEHDAPDAVHYVDPPYLHATRRRVKEEGKTAYGYRFEMREEDHRKVSATCNLMKGCVIVSGYPSELYDTELFPRPKWHRVERRHFTVNNHERTEVAWMNRVPKAHVQATFAL